MPGVLLPSTIAPEELAFVSLPFQVTLKIETGLSSPVVCTTVLLPLSATDEARYTSGITASVAETMLANAVLNDGTIFSSLAFLATSGSKMRISFRPVTNLDLALQFGKRGVDVRVCGIWNDHAANACGSAEVLPFALPVALFFFVVVEVLFEGRVA